MKIAIVRGDFANPWEMQNLKSLTPTHELTLITGLCPVFNLSKLSWMHVKNLVSPVDLNFRHVSRLTMALINRIFGDAHVLFRLESSLTGFDLAYCSETYYFYTKQCLDAKETGKVSKVVSLVWENIAFNNEGIWGRRAMKQRAIREMDKFVAITDKARDVLIEEGCDPKKIVRLNPGVDLTVFKPIKVKKSKNIKLLFVGRLVEEKGILDILAVFKTLRAKYKNLELVVVGSGPLANQVVGEGITYIGSVPYQDMPKMYSGADIYVHYSKGTKTWVEQYGFTLIEAMACGLPVVGLDVGSVKEVVRDGGFVVDAKNYVATLEKLITNKKLRDQTAKKALHLAKTRYDAYKYGQQLEKIFLSTLK